jgi:hypothetical protein
MSIHSDLMQAATDVLIAVQGDVGPLAPVGYQPTGGQAFRWEGSSIGAESGLWQPQEDGNVLKVTKLVVQGPTAALRANGVTELERDAVVSANGRNDWSIDLAESHWGPSIVRLGLFRRPISRMEENELRESR